VSGIRLLATFLVAAIAGAAAAQTVTERARSAASSVKQNYGSEETFTQNGVKPISTTSPMRTMNGTEFDAQMSCDASERFLRVTMVPRASSDIERFSVELDGDFDGAFETGLNFTGPFSGVCNNGVIRCDAGTWNNCQFLRWAMTGATFALEEVSQRDLGACYCINASCGSNLLLVNSRKVISDLGNSVLATTQRIIPRITSARNEADELSITYFGQASGCGADRSPEQYHSQPGALAAAGVAVRDQPGTMSSFLRGTSHAQSRGLTTLTCEINRTAETRFRAKSDILRQVSSTRGTAVDCGPNCMRFRIGDERQNLYRGGGGSRCHLATESQQYFVGFPDLIEGVRLTSGRFDDGLRLTAGSSIIYSSRPEWTAPGIPAPRCNWGNEVVNPNADVRAAFSTPGTLALVMDVAHDEAGEGWMWMEARVREGCALEREEVIDGCTAAASNELCRLKNEWVDEVQTVREFRTTGLGPLPSTRSVGASCSIEVGPRPWWRTRREYECRREASGYDGTAAVERYETIHRSIDINSGAFTDRRRTGEGTWSLENASIAVPTETFANACAPMCRTRKLRPGANIADAGPTTASLNATGVAYDFTYKECDETNACPLEAGEELANACDCQSNFAHAASLMQTIRMLAEDTACSAE
jgi:hypothetical protein